MQHCPQRSAAMEDVCFNCSAPFDDDEADENLEDGILSQQFTSSTCVKKRTKVNEIIMTNSPQSENSTTTTTTVSVSRALASIFKLEYLNAFSDEDEKKDDKELSLCFDCSEVLTQLYSLLHCFIQLQKLDSSLAHRIERLDEIIDCHQQRSINCDLITVPQKYSSTSNRKKNKLSVSCQSDSEIKNPSTFIFNREPRVILTRLPTISLPPPAQQQQQQNVFSHMEATEEDDDVPLSERIVKIVCDDDSFDDLVDPLLIESEPEDSDHDEEWMMPSGPVAKNNNLKRKRLPRRRNAKEEGIEISKQAKDKKKISPFKIKSSSESPHSSENEDDQNAAEDNVVNFESRSDNVDIVNKRIRGSNQKKEKPQKLKKKDTENRKGDAGPGENALYRRRRTKVPNPCWYCKLDFDTPALCLEHTKTDHKSKITSSSRICSRCSKICVNDRGLTNHLKKCDLIPIGVILPGQYKCPQCAKEFITNQELHLHTLHVHSNERSVWCDECDYKGKSVIMVQKHKRRMHKCEGDESKKCDECDAVLRNERVFKYHKIHWHTEKGRAAYRLNRERQKKRRRDEIEQASTVCDECGVDFFTRLRLTLHRKTSHVEHIKSSFVCHLCGNICLSARSLRSHINGAHSDARPFLCQECGRDFKTVQNLKNHQLTTHNEEGRLKYNAKVREKTQRRKLLKAQLASRDLLHQQGPSEFATGDFSNE